MAQYTQLEKIRQELDEAYQNEPEYDSDGFPTMKGMNRGSYFDFPNDFMDFASSHKRYLFSQRAKFLVLVLSIALIVVTVVRAIVGWATLYHLTGRIFILLPLAIEVFFNLLFAGFGCRAFGIKPLNSIVTGILVAIYLIGINYGLNITMFAYVAKYLKGLFEPDGSVNDDWVWLYQIALVYFVFTIISFVIQLLIVAIHFGYLKVSYNQSWFQPQIKDSFIVYIGVFSRIIYFVLLLCSLGIVIAAIASLIAATTGNGMYCNLPTATCFQKCDPLDPTECIFPFPSSYYLEEDPKSRTGYRVQFGSESLPITRDGGRLNPKYWNEMDGFSTIAPLLFYFNDLSDKGFAPATDLSFNKDVSTTVIINTRTNEVVPHWVELDKIDPIASPCAIIQPGYPLEFATRYVVAVRRLVTNKGEPVTSSHAFNLLKQDVPPENDELVSKERWQHFHDNVFPVLESIGWNKSELNLAWDFVTTSRESSLGVLERMRDDALARVAKGEATFDIYQVDNHDCSVPGTTIGRTVWGKVNVPFYLQSTDRGSFLNSNGNSRESVRQNGFKASRFVVRIPCTLIENPRPASLVVQYGHGLFGSRAELMSAVHGEYANRYGWIMFASDWYGMSKFDILVITKILLSEPSNFVKVPHSTMQGFINKAVTLQIVKSEEFARHEALTVNGISLMPKFSENNSIVYYGISQGGVVGGGYVGMSTDIKRAVLGVPGTPFALLLSRSHDFTPYKLLLGLEFYNWRHCRITITLMQQLWDTTESAGWLLSMNRSPGPNAPAKSVLIQAAIGDAQVTTLGAHIMARAYNASTVEPATRPIWGVPDRTAPFVGSAIVEWAYDDVPPEPIDNTPPSAEHDTHECPRREFEAQEQIRDFLQAGIVQQYCQGQCRKPRCKL